MTVACKPYPVDLKEEGLEMMLTAIYRAGGVEMGPRRSSSADHVSTQT